MKTKTTVGFFSDKQKVDKAVNSLSIAGFTSQSIITDYCEPYSLGIIIKDESEEKMAINILQFHQPTHTKQFDFDVENAANLKKIIEIHAKNEIRNSPDFHHHDHYHEGMNSEVRF